MSLNQIMYREGVETLVIAALSVAALYYAAVAGHLSIGSFETYLAFVAGATFQRLYHLRAISEKRHTDRFVQRRFLRGEPRPGEEASNRIYWQESEARKAA